ncbi:uncharacterized protein L3040_008049 [Drepanopeziza brunnea f. sp. 'multigermtubi']|uniref:uncharacterized protein n=1 Tax=Drepanopeziza brunnea f. sp. 'multigermtubi' TaxID=698441 RepID=UPI002385C217|nr:hypothetical protein L3040_008049 [Drepanopeziza brunnea f. sp. 'multigermtubi']
MVDQVSTDHLPVDAENPRRDSVVMSGELFAMSSSQRVESRYQHPGGSLSMSDCNNLSRAIGTQHMSRAAPRRRKRTRGEIDAFRRQMGRSVRARKLQTSTAVKRIEQFLGPGSGSKVSEPRISRRTSRERVRICSNAVYAPTVTLPTHASPRDAFQPLHLPGFDMAAGEPSRPGDFNRTTTYGMYQRGVYLLEITA